MKEKKDQEKQFQGQKDYPGPIQGVVDLFGPDQPKGQQVSAGEPKLTPQEYRQIVEKYRPKPPVIRNCVWAFGVGGLICAFAQVIQNGLNSFGVTGVNGAAATTTVMVLIGALLTGLGIYDEIGKRAGAGSIVPITGFANSMVAPAMEFKREGYVFGVGAKLFTIAGPVLVYGICTAFVVGLIRYFLR